MKNIYENMYFYSDKLKKEHSHDYNYNILSSIFYILKIKQFVLRTTDYAFNYQGAFL